MHSLLNAHLGQNCRLHRLYEGLHPLQAQKKYDFVCMSQEGCIFSMHLLPQG